MTENTTNEVEQHLPSIFENEANGLLEDLIVTPALMHLMMFATEKQVQAARNYIVSIFEECYRSGHMKIIGMMDSGTLYGYAIIFGHSCAGPCMYCHKIYVYKTYRRHGVGSQLLSNVLEQSQNVGLLCSSDLIPFYEKAGMKFKATYVPPNTHGFTQTQSMYAGLNVMVNHEHEGTGLPVFILNDNDIENIISAIVSCHE